MARIRHGRAGSARGKVRYELDGINVSEYLNGANYSSRTDSYTEDRVVGTETYVITDAYDETVTTCTICGAHS